MADRAKLIEAKAPDVMADVKMFTAMDGGKTRQAVSGWGCPCMLTRSATEAWYAFPILKDETLSAGDERRIGFVFLTPEGRSIISSVEKFYLFEGRIVGEAVVANDDPAPLWRLLDAVSDNDPEVAPEAALVLRMYLERACLSGDADWWQEVGLYLDVPEVLRGATGCDTLRDLHVHQKNVERIAFEALNRVKSNSESSWHFAYVIKQAMSVNGLEDAIIRHLAENWRASEAVALQLLQAVWNDQDLSETYLQIVQSAQRDDLRQLAKEKL